MKGDYKLLGDRIKRLREDTGLNQLELAKILNISNTTLSQYESGQRTPSDDIKIVIADYFNVSLDYLLGRINVKNPYEPETIAARHDGEEFTEEELEDIEKFKEFVKMRREQKDDENK